MPTRQLLTLGGRVECQRATGRRIGQRRRVRPMTDAPSMIDWDLAVRLGSRFAGEGPDVSAAAADDAVRELRAGAERSTGLVREFTSLSAAEHTAPVLVVDRAGWIKANAETFEKILTPIVGRLAAKKGTPGGISAAMGSRITGEIGRAHV